MTALRPDAISRAVQASMPLAHHLFRELAARTSDEVGVTRPSYDEGEQIAHDLVTEAARSLGLEIATDPAGNLYMTLPGGDRSRPAWLSGSHLDSVPRGGNYDGAAGVLAALTALAAIKECGIVPARDVTAMAIRSEEASSWWTGHHGGHLGSRATLGLLWPGELESAVHTRTGRTFAEQLAAAGFDSAAVRNGPPYLTRDRVAGFIEVHIEQGPVLEHEGLPVAVVTSIRGTVRARESRCIGAYTHSGAVPHELRQDAVLATAELVGELDRAWTRVREAGGDLVFTVGKIFTDPAAHGLSKVPGEVHFTLDIRSQEPETLTMMRERAEQLAAEIGRRRRVRFELGRIARGEPAAMDEGLRRRLVQGAETLGVRVREMPCGAGHDAADFVRAGIPAAMIFLRNANGSHNPDEHMEMADFQEGTRLLAWTLATMD